RVQDSIRFDRILINCLPLSLPSPALFASDAYRPQPFQGNPREFCPMHGGDPKGSATKLILIVEDNELNLKLLHDVLEAHGYATITTGEGKEALPLARQHWPDLILMDLQLPDISGLDAVAELKGDERTREIPVVAVTAFAL